MAGAPWTITGQTRRDPGCFMPWHRQSKLPLTAAIFRTRELRQNVLDTSLQ